ncbi:hypothetical protein WKI44_23000 [Vibrio alginolyticus]|uniref:hypothetical protein n=2 Tax=Vibrionaceae TaxID=641 RepID=UPI001BD258D8|nr:hypothetical protein [Vibrio alginolyticus]EGR1737541.1 hypothetical protein [Vibrio parahaemolyticus]EHV9686661.1 hypothetical protein [Vibrio parahaemolyticus]MBS9908181.1 hypothetical protein [Vibrio alginolyticus]MBS9986108.1 hypothetical protein [Vibrio alginolyticus]
MKSTHLDAEQRYSQVRMNTIKAAQVKLNKTSEYKDIELKCIDGKALKLARWWSNSTKRKVDWDWIEGYAAFKFRYPKRFELAIWSKGELLSLSLGRPTYYGNSMRLDFIEANPDISGTRVFPATLFTMITYAELLGATEVRVMKPINDDVKKYYQSFGLTYVVKGDYLYMRL